MLIEIRKIIKRFIFPKLMELLAFYPDVLCLKWRFKRGVLTGKIYQK